jgi:hypothetical protein
VDEGQLEHFGPREARGRVAGDRPSDVDLGLDHLVIEFRRPPAERHGGIDVDRDPAVRLFLDAPRPGLDERLVRGRLGAQEVVHVESHFLGGRRRGREKRQDAAEQPAHGAA